MATANKFFMAYDQGVPLVHPIRLVGALAADTAFTPGDSAKERVDVRLLKEIEVQLKEKTDTNFQGTLTLEVFLMDSEATADDGDGATQLTPGAATAVTVTTIVSDGDQMAITIDVAAYMYLEIVVSLSSAGGDTATIGFVDVFGVVREDTAA